MAVTITKDNYPEFDGTAGISGKRYVLYVNYGTSATGTTPKWVRVGGCEDLTFTPTVDVQTKQTKDSGMWATSSVSGKSFQVTSTILASADDQGQKVIENFIYDDDISNEKKSLQFARVNLDDKSYRVFNAIPTGFEETSKSDDLVEYSFTGTCTGKPEDKTGFTETTTSGT